MPININYAKPSMYITVTYLPAAIFFFTTLLSGFFVLSHPQKVATQNKLLLTFGGSFLFSLTLLHLFPEVYHHVEKYPYLRYCLLLGFLFQFFLDSPNSQDPSKLHKAFVNFCKKTAYFPNFVFFFKIS